LVCDGFETKFAAKPAEKPAFVVTRDYSGGAKCRQLTGDSTPPLEYTKGRIEVQFGHTF
jgi:hypothetical protein